MYIVHCWGKIKFKYHAEKYICKMFEGIIAIKVLIDKYIALSEFFMTVQTGFLSAALVQWFRCKSI